MALLAVLLTFVLSIFSFVGGSKTGKTFTEMEELVNRLANAREACLTKSNAPPAIEVRMYLQLHVTGYCLLLLGRVKVRAGFGWRVCLCGGSHAGGASIGLAPIVKRYLNHQGVCTVARTTLVPTLI